MRSRVSAVPLRYSQVSHLAAFRYAPQILCRAAVSGTDGQQYRCCASLQVAPCRRTVPPSSTGGPSTFSRLGASCFGPLRSSRVCFAQRRGGVSRSKRTRGRSTTGLPSVEGNTVNMNKCQPLRDNPVPVFKRWDKKLATNTITSTSDSSSGTGAPPSASRMAPSFYSVAVGLQRGIYSNWDQCSEQVKGFSGAVYKRFRTLSEARAFLTAHAPPSGSVSHDKDSDAATDAASSRAEAGVKHPRAATEAVEVSALPLQRRRVEGDTQKDTAIARRTGSSVAQVVYVDGACSRNGTANARAGYGGYYGTATDPRNFSLAVPLNEAQTNNRGELRAVIHCIVQGFIDAGAPQVALTTSHCVAPVWDLSELTQPLRRLVIYTDSRYVIDGLTRYSIKWVDNGFKLASKEPVMNQDLWKQLIKLRDAYNTRYAEQQHQAEAARGNVSRCGVPTPPPQRFHVHNTRNDETEGIELRHVKGHSNNYGNEMADTLAVSGARRHDSQA